MNISPGIFKAYDIRGIVDETLTESAVHLIGMAFGVCMRERGFTSLRVGRDGRLSGPRLQAALMDGLLQAGVDVIDIGLCTTPMMYIATLDDAGGCGIQVTGSHNPPKYNGLKLMLGGDTLHGEQVQDLRRRVQALAELAASPCSPKSAPRGRLSVLDTRAAYLDRIAADIRLSRPMRVVVDAGNGVGGLVAGEVFRRLGCEVVELFCEVDGHFPNHHPDPSRPDNLKNLIAAVSLHGADIGLAVDGDADRLGVVTRSGRIIDADRVLMLLARDVLSHHSGATVVFDVKCSRLLPQEIAKAGGIPLMWKTGHSVLKAKLRETGAPLAGEMSGHLFFADRWHGFDDGWYAGARLLEILSRHDDPGSVLDALPDSVSTPELLVPLPEGRHFEVAALLQATADFPDALSVSRIDGLRADFADGFGLVRASNTNPVLTLRFEADTSAALDRIQRRFQLLIDAAIAAVASEADRQRK